MIANGKMKAAEFMITYQNPHLQVPLQLARQRKPGTHVGIGIDVDPGAAQLCIVGSWNDSMHSKGVWLAGWPLPFVGMICDCFRSTRLVYLMS